MNNIHEHLKGKIIKYKHKFPATLYRGVAITEFNAEELRALICVLGERQRFMTELPDVKWRKLGEDADDGPGEEDGPWAGEGWAERCGVKHGDAWECPNCTAPGKLRTSSQYDIMVEDAIRWNKHSEQWECHDCWLN